MSPAVATSIHSRAQVILALADMLERLDTSAELNGDQYLTVVARLSGALVDPLQEVVLDAVLSGHPAAQTLFEATREESAALACRS